MFNVAERIADANEEYCYRMYNLRRQFDEGLMDIQKARDILIEEIYWSAEKKKRRNNDLIQLRRYTWGLRSLWWEERFMK